jgi:hypothetical protein
MITTCLDIKKRNGNVKINGKDPCLLHDAIKKCNYFCILQPQGTVLGCGSPGMHLCRPPDDLVQRYRIPDVADHLAQMTCGTITAHLVWRKAPAQILSPERKSQARWFPYLLECGRPSPITSSFRRSDKRPENGRLRAAVVGAGPAGLTAARTLIDLWHELVVFEEWLFTRIQSANIMNGIRCRNRRRGNSFSDTLPPAAEFRQQGNDSDMHCPPSITLQSAGTMQTTRTS